MKPKYSLVLPIENQLETKRRKRNSGGLWECHMLSQTSINVNWEIQQASMLCKPLKYAAQNITATEKDINEFVAIDGESS